MGELEGGSSDDGGAGRPLADLSLPELLGRTVGRHLEAARIVAGLALTIAALGLLALFVQGAVVPFRYERSGPPIGEVCVAQTGQCFTVDQDAIDEAFEDDMNRSNRFIGALGAVTSGAALVVGWRLWRPSWRRRRPATRGARLVVAAACLSPVAAAAVFAVVAVLHWSYSSLV